MTAARPKLAVFRLDASPRIGAGHAMRCLALADALRADGWDTAFATAPGAVATVPALAGHTVLEIDAPAEDEPGVLEARWPDGCRLLVVDHYGRDADFERACRPWCEAILAIDDLADRAHDCDLLLDQTPGRVTADYEGLVPPGCRMLLGAAYALLRGQFAAAREAALGRRGEGPARRILVSLGGGDMADVTSRVLDAIALAGFEGDIDVVLGAGASEREATERRVKLHTDVRDMAPLMARADLAIGAAGGSSWERCCLGLPTIVLITGDNQRAVAAALTGAGAAKVMGDAAHVPVADLAGAVREIAADAARLSRMAVAAAGLCDGLGAGRVGSAVSDSRPGHPRGGARPASGARSGEWALDTAGRGD